jgi:hypothetical protein
MKVSSVLLFGILSHIQLTQITISIKYGEFDITPCLAEVNVCWKKLSETDKMKERLRGCFETSHYVMSYNLDKELKEKRQFGGTTIISTNSSCQRITSCGVDQTNMGRWNWKS